MIGDLPRELHDQAGAVVRSAWKLGAKDGNAGIQQFASWVEKAAFRCRGELAEKDWASCSPSARSDCPRRTGQVTRC